MPISSQAPRGEGPETRSKDRRREAPSKREGSTVVTADRDIVPSGGKPPAAARRHMEVKRPCVKTLEDTVAEAIVVPEEIRGEDLRLVA
jgi:hypothetical protein